MVRAAAWAHLLVLVVEGVGWDTLAYKWPTVVLTDLLHGEQKDMDRPISWWTGRWVNSLNIVSAASVVLFQVQEMQDRMGRVGVVKFGGSVC